MSDDLSMSDRAKAMGISAGGALAGGALGHLATIPINKRYLAAAEANAYKEFKDKKLSMEHWENMIKIFKGEISIEQFPPEKQEFYKKMMEENKYDIQELARDKRKFDQMKRDHTTGNVFKFPGEKPKKSIFDGMRKVNIDDMKNVQPIFGGKNGKLEGVLPKPYHTVQNPRSKALPGLGGLIGLIVANEVANQHFQEKEENQKKNKPYYF